MSKSTCSISECARPHAARGWCNTHYMRFLRTGTASASARVRGGSPEAKINRDTAWDGDCLVWTAGLDVSGYGSIWVDGKHRGSHVVAWEVAHGPIPSGMVIDHICHNRACCNVDHLRLANERQNRWNLGGANINSATGVRGVHPFGNGKYRAVVYKAGKRHHLGLFETVEEAERVVIAKRAELFGEYAGKSRRNT